MASPQAVLLVENTWPARADRLEAYEIDGITCALDDIDAMRHEQEQAEKLGSIP